MNVKKIKKIVVIVFVGIFTLGSLGGIVLISAIVATISDADDDSEGGGSGADNNASEDDILEVAYKIISANEGSYDTVVPNDNGAVSIGKCQWHANRALDLLKKIKDEMGDSSTKKILGSTLFEEISKNADWGKRTFTNESDKVKAMKTFISSDEGKKVQDDLAKKDIAEYLNIGRECGITDPRALIYFADGINQYGSNSSLWKNDILKKAKKLGNGECTLESIHKATMNTVDNYKDRRKKTYEALKEVTFEGKGGYKLPILNANADITSTYGYRILNGERNYHTGIDIGGIPEGTPIYASKAGIATVTDYGKKGKGKNICLKHKDGTMTDYSHCSEFLVETGDEVSAGQIIGKVGCTGNSYGAHLHFEIYETYEKSSRVDPEKYVTYKHRNK